MSQLASSVRTAILLVSTTHVEHCTGHLVAFLENAVMAASRSLIGDGFCRRPRRRRPRRRVLAIIGVSRRELTLPQSIISTFYRADRR